MIKKVKIFQDLPIEEGKTYRTRFATGDLFFVEKVIKVKEKVIRFDGLYVGKENIGTCPLAVDRLIADRILVGEKIICDDLDFDLTDLLKKTFEAGQEDGRYFIYDNDINNFLKTIQ